MRMAQHIAFRYFLILAMSAAGAPSAHAQKADPALFGALPAVDQAKVSPNGETVAVLQNQGGNSLLVFVELADPTATPKGVGMGQAKARQVDWVDDEYVLLLASVTQDVNTTTGMQTIEFERWFAVSKEDPEPKMLFQRDAGYYVAQPGELLSTLPDKSGEVVMARWSSKARISGPKAGLGARFTKEDSGTGYSLFNVKLESVRERITSPGQPETEDWVVNAKGDPVLRIDYDERKAQRKIFHRKGATGSFNLVKIIEEPGQAGATINFHAVDPDGVNAIATTYGSGNTRSLVKYNLETGAISETLFRNDQYDLDSINYDPRTATVTSVEYTDDLPRTVHLNADDQELQDKLARALQGSAPKITSRSADGSKMTIRAIYQDRPDEIYTFDQDTRNLAFFSSEAPGIADRVYAEKTKYDYVAPDGLTINGYLTTPAGAEKSNMPLIVLPHGGPESRDDLSFDWWSFFYAARGYAVYQPNFRGSSGYGASFRRAGYGEWGRKMQDDITNGVRKLIDDGIADPDRICIVGASYGGYAALAGATLTPDLYACAVSVNGVSDLPRMIGEAAQISSIGAAYWETRIGSRFRDGDELAAVSPARRAARAGAPIMLIHGKDDTVVPFYHSEIMRDALAEAGKPHEFVALDGEDHWLSSGASRTEMLRASIEFIDRHIGGE